MLTDSPGFDPVRWAEAARMVWDMIGYWLIGLVALFIVCRWSPFRRRAAPKEEE